MASVKTTISGKKRKKQAKLVKISHC